MLRTSTTLLALLLLAYVSCFPFNSRLHLANQPENQISGRENFVRIARKEANPDSGFKPYIQFKEQPGEVIIDGNSRFLQCHAMGNPKPRIYWLKNGQIVEQSPPRADKFVSTQALDDEANKYGLLGLSLVKSHLFLDGMANPEGMYTCVAEADHQQPIFARTKVNIPRGLNKEAEGNENLVEYQKPFNAVSFSQESGLTGSKARIYYWTETTLENIGADAVLHCRATGGPKPIITWSFNDNSVDKEIVQDNHKYLILESGDLVIRNLSFDEMGQYKCTASNIYGSDSISKIFLYPTEPSKEDDK